MIQSNLTRRQLLAATGGVLVLAACGDDSKGPAAKPFSVVQRFPSDPLFPPGEVRLPVSLATEGTLGDGPATLNGWIEDFNGGRVTDITVNRRAEGIEIPYWDVRATLSSAGVYTMRFEGDDGFGASFELFDESEIQSPLTGAPLPPFDTPTVDDHRGVEPYCSLTPDPCPLHDVTLTEALAAAAANGTPLIYMVGTPAHCQTGTCAPGLEFLIAEHGRVGEGIAMVHADVFADNAATIVAPAVVALDVLYEPILYFCTSDGVIVDRLDGIWDAGELTERIDLLLAR